MTNSLLPATRLVFTARSLPASHFAPVVLDQDIYGPITVTVTGHHVIVETTRAAHNERDAEVVKSFVCKETGIRANRGLYTTRLGGST